jgi:hypothetical protein
LKFMALCNTLLLLLSLLVRLFSPRMGRRIVATGGAQPAKPAKRNPWKRSYDRPAPDGAEEAPQWMNSFAPSGQKNTRIRFPRVPQRQTAASLHPRLQAFAPSGAKSRHRVKFKPMRAKNNQDRKSGHTQTEQLSISYFHARLIRRRMLHRD